MSAGPSAIVALSGNDTVSINGTVLTGGADGNIAELTYATDIANVKTGKDGNSIYALNQTGRQCELKLRLVRGCSDDKMLQQLLNMQIAHFSGFPLLIGQLVKKIGDGTGSPTGVTKDVFVLSGGIFMKNVEGKTNVDGDVEQAVAVYMLKFSNAPRKLT